MPVKVSDLMPFGYSSPEIIDADGSLFAQFAHGDFILIAEFNVELNLAAFDANEAASDVNSLTCEFHFVIGDLGDFKFARVVERVDKIAEGVKSHIAVKLTGIARQRHRGHFKE